MGGGKLRGELGNQYTDDLFKLYGDRLPNFSDLVCYWFEKARAMIVDDKVQRAGLLATKSIRRGANRTVLQRIKQTGDIFWAQSDRDWMLDGAAVNVSMVGFDDGGEPSRVLDGKTVSEINPDLTSAVDLTGASRLVENIGLCFMGPSAKAPFDIDGEIARNLLATTNASGRANSDVIRPVASAIDLVQRSRDKWTVDFALMTFEEASQYEAPLEYVRQVVLPARESRRDDYRGMWWQDARPRPEMRDALRGLHRYIATPGVSKHRIMCWTA